MTQTIVIFGASGDLTSRKLIPALYSLHQKKRLAPDTRIVGFARTEFSHEAWRQRLAESTSRFVGEKFDASIWDALAPRIFYSPGSVDSAEDFQALRRLLQEIEGDEAAARMYYLAMAPQFYGTAVAHLGAAGLAGETHGSRRIVVEKPFGTDLASARQVNRQIHEVFAENQVYRIDHYLGKETVQNVLVLRFANTIFEPVWNRNYIEHVEITAAEALTVGHRAGYYDTAGVLRDMLQGHLLQLLSLAAMETPVRFEAEAVRDEKVKVLRAVRPLRPEDVATDTLRGQYDGYRAEAGVRPDSQTATFAAVKLHVDNWRWQGVPFYLRSGKAMSCGTTQLVIQFREPPYMLFEGGPRDHRDANRLIIQIQPAEGIQLHFQTKVPDAGMQLRMTDLSFRFREKFSGPMPEAYQRLLLDVSHGDPSLFARADEVEAAWSLVDPIQAAWDEAAQPPLLRYEPGEWGPVEATEWMGRQERLWFDACPVLH
ncbi:MAG: glucose-6-phosphate dehydrogenase [Planctomycetota bacterium]|nr:glucose-6-phosphate dehydrogenase [Planctomycetota bacterium]